MHQNLASGQGNSPREGVYVFGSYIDALTWEMAISKISSWARNDESRYICICNVHSVVTALQDQRFKRIINNADMATADGMPIAWYLRKFGYSNQKRINGPDLMWKYCKVAEKAGYPIYLIGSTEQTIEALKNRLETSFPNLEIAGHISPPFREMSNFEDAQIVKSINDSGAKIVFVGLGCPKQEKWMADNRGKINSVMIGVGAAFDFHAGTAKRAPTWIQKSGLEWCHRLLSDPRRLWKRYLIANTIFLFMLVKEVLSNNSTRGRHRGIVN